MDRAVCIRCGALKPMALGQCPQCQFLPRSEEDLVGSLALSDRHHDSDTLKLLGLKIAQGGAPPELPEERDDAIRGAARHYNTRFGPLLDRLDAEGGDENGETPANTEEMRARFADNEWAVIRTLPIQVFGFIAGADGKIDRDEINDLIDQIAEADRLPSPLHRAIMQSISREKDFWSLLQLAESYAETMEKSREIKRILKNALRPDEYEAFMRSLFWSGLEIAQASGGGPFGLMSPVSKSEQSNLDAFAELYEFEPNA